MGRTLAQRPACGGQNNAHAALILRTVFQRRGRAWLRVGAGIVGQSTWTREWEETCEKLRSIAPYLRSVQPTGGTAESSSRS